jgi:hypothetical protein
LERYSFKGEKKGKEAESIIEKKNAKEYKEGINN